MMNNKLKKLANQAGFGLRDGELYTAKLEHLPITQNMEKFAELIVKETKMSKLFLDCEYNGFGGKLISMALVPEDPALPEFYREVEMNSQLDPWVRDNVVPHLVLIPVSFSQFQTDLADYLWKMGEVTIIADWPDDIRYFCESLITGPGMMLNFINNLKFELDFGIEYESVVPHNALHDARAIRVSYLGKKTIDINI